MTGIPQHWSILVSALFDLAVYFVSVIMSDSARSQHVSSCSSCSCSLHVHQPLCQSRTLFEESTSTGSNQCSCTKGFVYQFVYAAKEWTSISVKKLVGCPNSNYLLVIVPTFVMPYSITLNPRMTPGCTTQRFACHECIRVLVDYSYYSYYSIIYYSDHSL